MSVLFEQATKEAQIWAKCAEDIEQSLIWVKCARDIALIWLRCTKEMARQQDERQM